MAHLTISDDMLALIGFAPTRPLALGPSDRTVHFTIPATTLMAEVAALQIALQGGGYTSADPLDPQSFWTLAADVLMQRVYREIDDLNIPSFNCHHHVVPDDNLNPMVEGTIICSTPGEAVALKMRLG